MNRPLRISITLFEALVIFGAVYFEPTCCVRGRLHGEAFFHGKPTSWWRVELSRWEKVDLVYWRGSRGTTPFFQRTATLGERWTHWNKDTVDFIDSEGPTLLQGEFAALPVLFELRQDASPELRALVERGLQKAGVAP